MADGLGIDESLVKVIGLRSGSVIVDYTLESDGSKSIEEI
jgi:hypothetical protein